LDEVHTPVWSVASEGVKETDSCWVLPIFTSAVDGVTETLVALTSINLFKANIILMTSNANYMTIYDIVLRIPFIYVWKGRLLPIQSAFSI
jgi:hypothetical protein